MRKVALVSTVIALLLMMIVVSTWNSGFAEVDRLSEETGGRETSQETKLPEKESIERVKPLGERPEKGWTFGFSSMGSDTDYYVEVEKLLTGYIHQGDDTIISMCPKEDGKLQAEQLREMMKMGVDAIFLDPINIETLLPVLEELEENNIPVVNMSQEIWGKEIAVVDSDNFNSGYILGDYMVNTGIRGKNFYEKTKAVVFSEERGNNDREAIYGFNAAIGDACFKVEREIVCSHDKESVEKELKLAVEELEDFYYVLSLCDEMTSSILKVCEEQNYDQLKVLTIGGSPAMKKKLLDGDKNLVAIAAKSPSSRAMNAYSVMMQYLDGYGIKEQYLTETFLLTSENIWNYPIGVWQ